MHLIRTFVILALLAPGVPAAAGAEHPPALAIGSATVPRAGQAERVHLLGQDLYTLAIYAPGTRLDREQLASTDVPKALRIEIRYKDDLRRPFGVDWQRELVPRIDADAASQLRGTFAPLRQGDVVLVEYVPGKGTAVRVNKGVAVSGGHHDLMLAFLDHWIGQRPLSEEIKRALLGSS